MPETAPLIDAPDPARRFVLLNSFEAVRTALEHLVGFLSEHGADNDNLGLVELALAEALNNIVEHAYVDTTGLIELT